jgi:hypothetical protein
VQLRQACLTHVLLHTAHSTGQGSTMLLLSSGMLGVVDRSMALLFNANCTLQM